MRPSLCRFLRVFWKFWNVRNCAGVKRSTNCTSDGRKVQRWNGNRLPPELCLVAIPTDLSPHRQVWMLAKERAQPFSPTTLAPTRTTTQMSKNMESWKAYFTCTCTYCIQSSHPNHVLMHVCLSTVLIPSPLYVWEQSIFTHFPSIFLFRLWAQGLVKIWSWSSGKILKLEFGLRFAVFCRGYEVESGLNKLLW